jgi:hypothetical protein
LQEIQADDLVAYYRECGTVPQLVMLQEGVYTFTANPAGRIIGDVWYKGDEHTRFEIYKAAKRAAAADGWGGKLKPRYLPLEPAADMLDGRTTL